MAGLTCNACNKEFVDDSERKQHYKSEWHRYNLKRKIAGVPGVIETLFIARQSALAQEKSNLNETPMLYSCRVCGKGYKSSKAHDQHLKSRSHLLASQRSDLEEGSKAIIKPILRRAVDRAPPQRNAESEESGDEWEEVVSEEDDAGGSDDDMNDAYSMEKFLDPSCCFMCDLEHDSIETCMIHMHKKHGFFIPDVEYLKDAKGLLTYLGLKVRRDFTCLYCNDRCQSFNSLEAVRKHMEAKMHCKVHYGDGDDEEEEAELEDFYDYSSSYVDEDGKQLVTSGDMDNSVELGSGGWLNVVKKSVDGTSAKTLGAREFLRYYRQKPRPSPANNTAISSALATRYRSMGLSTVQSREKVVKMKVMKKMNISGVEAMHTKIGMKSNVIRNLPRNVTY